MKKNVNKITNKKINKNTEFDSNILLQNQQKINNHDLYYKEHDHKKCDCEFYRDKNIQNFFIKFKTNNEKKKHKFIICYCYQKKKHYINKYIISALIKNINIQ